MSEDICKELTPSRSQEELERVFDNYYSKIFNYFRSRISSREEAQDLTGEVFVKIAGAWERYDPERAAVSTWIFTIARNVLTDFLRRNRGVTLELEELPVTDRYNNLENSDSREAILKAMTNLNDKEKEVLVLKYWSDLGNQEIASMLGISASQVGVVLYRSLKKLQPHLKDFM